MQTTVQMFAVIGPGRNQPRVSKLDCSLTVVWETLQAPSDLESLGALMEARSPRFSTLTVWGLSLNLVFVDISIWTGSSWTLSPCSQACPLALPLPVGTSSPESFLDLPLPAGELKEDSRSVDVLALNDERISYTSPSTPQ